MSKKPSIVIVPHKSISLIESKLTEIFESIKTLNPSRIFVFGKLHNGPIGFDDDFTIYTDSCCPVDNTLLTKNDDVCTEEYGAEILRPFCDRYFNGIPVNQFLTPGKNAANSEFFNAVCKEFSNALIFISKNEQEDSVWPESLQD